MYWQYNSFEPSPLCGRPFHSPDLCRLTHWCRVTHICVSNLSIIVSDNGLPPGRRQAIIRTNAGTLLIRPLGTNSSEILIELHIFSFKKMHLKWSSAKWRPFCLGLHVLRLCCHCNCLLPWDKLTSTVDPILDWCACTFASRTDLQIIHTACWAVRQPGRAGWK